MGHGPSYNHLLSAGGRHLQVDRDRTGICGKAIDLLWRAGTHISGSLDPLRHLTRLNLLKTVQLLAMNPQTDVDLVPELIEEATPVDDTRQLHAIATRALARPEIMRWITANAARVDRAANWRAVVPGLGGTTVSVPLAEEALTKLMSAKSALPRELAEYGSQPLVLPEVRH